MIGAHGSIGGDLFASQFVLPGLRGLSCVGKALIPGADSLQSLWNGSWIGPRNQVRLFGEAVEKPNLQRLMENVHPAVPCGTNPGIRPAGVGTEPERSAGKEIPRNEA